MKKTFLQHGVALPALALVLGLLSGCPNMMGRSSHSAPAGEGLALVSLAAPEEGAVSPGARTAAPLFSSLYFTLTFTKETNTVQKNLDRAASIEVSLTEGTWALEVTGYSDSNRTGAALEGSATVTVAAGGTTPVTVNLTGITGGTGSIGYTIRFPADADAGTLTLNNYADSTPYRTIDLRVTADGNTFTVANGVATATGTMASVPGGYYQALAKISTPDYLYAGYSTLVHVYSNAVTPLRKDFAAGNFSTNPMVDDLNLGGLVTAPTRGAFPDTTAINHALYEGTVAWKESDETTDVSGNFAANGVYKALLSLTAKEGFSFVGVGENTFSYPGATVSHPAGTGATIAVTITFPPTTVPGLRYVKENGVGNGSSWDHASGDLQKMIDEAGADKAADSGVTAIVRVAAGTYKPRYAPSLTGTSISDAEFEANSRTARDKTFILRPGVEILGGYPDDASNTTNDTDRNWTANPVILSGDIDNNDTTTIVGNNAYHVVLGVDIPNDGTTILDGFTIKGGNADVSKAFYINGGSMRHNLGGGIYNVGSSPVLTNVNITGNSAGSGGGIYNVGSSPVLTNVNIAGNSASGGGGIYNSGSSSSVLTNVNITGNFSTAAGGGMYNASSSPVLTNVIFAGNSTNSYGGGMYNYSSSSPVLTNVTIAGNHASADQGGGISNNNSLPTPNPSPEIRNSIIWGNSTGIDTIRGTPAVFHSIVQGGWTGTGSDNLNIDPVFVAPVSAGSAPSAEGNYGLQSTSPAINMGDNAYYPDTWAKWQAIETLIGTTILTEAVYNARVQPALAKDAGGANRFRDAYTADSSTDIDLGAYEEQTGVTPAALRYVKAGVTGGGGSWGDASGDLQAMVDQAGRAKKRGATQALVRVAAGTYKPLYAPGPLGQSLADAALGANSLTPRDKTFFLRPGVEIRGGYIAAGETIDETARKARFNAAGEPLSETHRAVLSGDIDDTPDGGNAQDGFTGMDGNAYHVVLGVDIPDDDTTILDGLTVKGGNANGATNFNVDMGSGSRQISRGDGGGVYTDHSFSMLTNVTIVGNSAGGGGGMRLYSSSPLLTNVTIAGNSSDYGGGIYNGPASLPTLTNVTIAGNSAQDDGGGMYNITASYLGLINVTIAGNSAQNRGGGVCCDFGHLRLFNGTIAGNTATTGGGIYFDSIGSDLIIQNSIIWGNSPSGIYIYSDTPKPFQRIDHSIVQGGWTGWGGGNMDIDPEFVGTGNHRLGANSPAINMGNNADYPDTWEKWWNHGLSFGITEAKYNAYILPALAKDLGGADRFAGTYIDLGAYEVQGGAAMPDWLRYVKEGGTGNGASWETASGDLQAMIDQTGRAAKQRGATQALVRVAAGTYKPLYAPGPLGQSLADVAFAANSLTPRDKTFILRPGVEIRGGYIAAGETIDETARKARFNAAGEPLNEAHRAVLSGDIDDTADGGNAQDGFTGMDGNAYHVVLGVDIPDDGTTILDGLTVKGGNANGSRDITVNSLSVFCYFGGGIYDRSSSLVLTNVTIAGNSAHQGGGMYGDGISTVLTNVTITGNYAYKGGGMYGDGISTVLTNATIAGNYADDGGGIYDSSYSTVLTNATIAGNYAYYDGGGIYGDSSLPVLTNVTITGNSASDVGGGIYYLPLSSPYIRNSIIWGNSPDGINAQSGTAIVCNSIVQGGWTGSDSGNLDIDPEFAGPGNHRLGANSPAINMGNNDYYPDTWAKWYSQINNYYITEAIYNAYFLPALAKDLGGEDRIKPLGGIVDMGAYEEPGGIGAGASTITLTITDQGNDAFSRGTFTLSKAASQSQTVTVGGTGFSDPRWYVDGIKKAEGTSITIDAAMYMTGKHSLGLWVTKNGKPWSKELDFTVAD